MGIQSPSVSITRYRVMGELERPRMETILRGLKKHVITEIDGDASETAAGWTAFHRPFEPDFEGQSFVYGALIVFSLRIDRKSLPSKLLHKHFMLASTRRLAETGQRFLSRHEKQQLREQVSERLLQRVPAIPHLYDVVWNLEQQTVSFFSNLKAANEMLETLFARSFGVSLIRLFPYTYAELSAGLADDARDALRVLPPSDFSGSP